MNKAKKVSKKKTQRKTKKDICFVIMPYGGWFDEYYEKIYKLAIEKAGLNPFRADDLYRPSQIIQDIWEHTKKAKIILADLTDKNPNVFYELGLAHALAKPAVLVTESIEDVPYDLRGLRIIDYDKNLHDWGNILQKDITAAVSEVLESPVKSIPSTFLEEGDKRKDKITDKEAANIKKEVELLRREIMTQGTIMHNRRAHTSSSEAEERIKKYIKMGMPTRLIIRRLMEIGIPEGWIERKILEIKNI